MGQRRESERWTRFTKQATTMYGIPRVEAVASTITKTPSPLRAPALKNPTLSNQESAKRQRRPSIHATEAIKTTKTAPKNKGSPGRIPPQKAPFHEAYTYTGDVGSVGNCFRLPNHDCRPSALLAPFKVSSRWIMGIQANQDIFDGSEITITYGRDFFG